MPKRLARNQFASLRPCDRTNRSRFSVVFLCPRKNAVLVRKIRVASYTYTQPSAPSMLTSIIHVNAAHLRSNAVKFLPHFSPLPIPKMVHLPKLLPSSFPNASPYLQSAKRTSRHCLRNFEASNFSFLPLKICLAPPLSLSSLSLSVLQRYNLLTNQISKQ
jgi:hypothetical protein